MGAGRRLSALALAASCRLLAQTHAGLPIPKYVTGDECLFCHRVKVADTWEKNPHARTIHPRDSEDFPPNTEYVLGSHPPERGLKPDGYGEFDLLSSDGKAWDRQAFALRCAGCHTTAVDPQTHTFSTASLDCYACHGVAPQNHPNDISLVWFSKTHARDPKQIVSICGQCHLRGGKSKANGLPYPDNFVAGDNLFEDFQVDFAQVDDANPNPATAISCAMPATSFQVEARSPASVATKSTMTHRRGIAWCSAAQFASTAITWKAPRKR